MKKLILIGMILLILPFSSAAPVKDITLSPGGSYLLDGKNITLARSSEEGTLLCINGEITIVSKDKRVQNIFIDYRGSDEQKARFKLQYECDEDCGCDGDECDNSLCIGEILAVNDNTTLEDEPECNENADCDDNDSCTADMCSGGRCSYQDIEGCGFFNNKPEGGGIQSNDRGVQGDNRLLGSLAYVLLVIVIVLVLLSVIKTFILDRKK